MGRGGWICACALLAIAFGSASVYAQQYTTFHSDEFSFTMKYPATWVKINNPEGNYYKVFQSPEKTGKFRPRIHVAAHKPVKAPLEDFLKEMRKGIEDLQKQQGAGEQQPVSILDEGPFKCDVPGAYYFFIQALEDKINVWMDIVIVFYKYDQTLLRISCLAPSSHMEQFHQAFNDVLVSVRFDGQGGAATESVSQPSPAAPSPGTPPSSPSPETAPSPDGQSGPAQPPSAAAPVPAPRQPAPGPGTVPNQQSFQQPTGSSPGPSGPSAAPAPRSAPGVGPSGPPPQNLPTPGERPPTGIVE
jgi:hypothetical protein